jgi:hypothetical protein
MMMMIIIIIQFFIIYVPSQQLQGQLMNGASRVHYPIRALTGFFLNTMSARRVAFILFEKATLKG